MKIAFVTPWYGPDIPGGMEAETRRTAERLAAAGMAVEVLTTTIRDFFSDWATNHHRPGEETIGGVTLRRFPVGPRDRARFDEVNWRLMQGLPVDDAAARTYVEEMINAPALYEHIRAQGPDTLFFFIPYMFATTYFGAQVRPEQSLVIPCLHDESYARLPLYRPVFTAVRGLIFHTEAEAALADDLYPPSPNQVRLVLGEGVDTEWSGDPQRFRARYGLREPFVLVVGRKDAGKNTPELLDYWRHYVARHGRAARLIFVGPGEVQPTPDMAGTVRDLGFVPEQDKRDAHAAAALLCQPSRHESFSLAVTDSWVAGRPVLVHGHCAVTREQCLKANGGLYYENREEFAAALHYLLSQPTVAAQLGRQGRRYVLANFRWELIVERYRRLVRELAHDA